MTTEIERKFLVTGNAWRQPTPVRFSQGYLNRDPERTVRVRLAGEEALLTIKGLTIGISRVEFEYAIPVVDAEQLLKLCQGPIIVKARHVVVHQGTTWEVDEFFGDNAGLVVAEVELDDEHQSFERPDWLGMEVTEDARYFNSNLATHPYSSWRNRAGA
jgi:adenylate cyclase